MTMEGEGDADEEAEGEAEEAEGGVPGHQEGEGAEEEGRPAKQPRLGPVPEAAPEAAANGGSGAAPAAPGDGTVSEAAAGGAEGGAADGPDGDTAQAPAGPRVKLARLPAKQLPFGYAMPSTAGQQEEQAEQQQQQHPEQPGSSWLGAQRRHGSGTPARMLDGRSSGARWPARRCSGLPLP